MLRRPVKPSSAAVTQARPTSAAAAAAIADAVAAGAVRAMSGKSAKPRKTRVQRGGDLTSQKATLDIILAFINSILGAVSNDASETITLSGTTYTLSYEGALLNKKGVTSDQKSKIAFTSNMAQLEMYLKMKIASLGYADYKGTIFTRDDDDTVVYYVNTSSAVCSMSATESAPVPPSAAAGVMTVGLGTPVTVTAPVSPALRSTSTLAPITFGSVPPPPPPPPPSIPATTGPLPLRPSLPPPRRVAAGRLTVGPGSGVITPP